jgi:UDP-N-acetylmuramoyl-L-alanyl-D-glutamate--2,6-diaminopimelate ligase
MLLCDLLTGIVSGDLARCGSVDITSLALDSRKVVAGALFFAYPGVAADGRQYINAAVAAGAAAVLFDIADDFICPAVAITCIGIADLANKVGSIAAKFYGNPSAKLKIFAVTGTNGKSSCVHYLAQLLTGLKEKCWQLGTLGSGFAADLHNIGHTTPDPITMQAELARAVSAGATACAMEVSSHALVQGRVAGVTIDVAIFTNISHDHLDYHHTLENYVAAKALLFPMAKKAVVFNIDDGFGSALAAKEYASTVWSYGLRDSKKNNYLTAEILAANVNGTELKFIYAAKEYLCTIKLLGVFNVENVLASVTALLAADYAFASILPLLPKLSAVTGRMQYLSLSNGAIAIIDYAHTPDALAKVLQTLRNLQPKKLTCVFGCGGDRDKTKRPLMLAVARASADCVIVTSDNPRNEQIADIIADMLQGQQYANVSVIHDRAAAIHYAVKNIVAGEVVLIAGKGHEETQIIGDQINKFSDIECVKQCR